MSEMYQHNFSSYYGIKKVKDRNNFVEMLLDMQDFIMK